MATFPLALGDLFGHWGSYSVYLIIGVAFGYVLENAGFGVSTKLAAQFYFKEMTVFKVMFTAVVVAMVLIYGAIAIGILDGNLIFIPETFVWSGLLGGFIMGVGFVIGGFCPGTSLVASATLKIDGWFFVGGVLFGIFVFGETVENFPIFFDTTNLGRYTLDEFLHLPTGMVITLIVLIALFAFIGAEVLENRVGHIDKRFHQTHWRKPAAAITLLLAVGVWVIGQPTADDRWAAIADVENERIANGEVQISPEEILYWMNDAQIRVRILDIRREADFNRFHIIGAEHWDTDQLTDKATIAKLHLAPANTLFFIVGNDESAALATWKQLRAETVPNTYIMAGGINEWVATYTNAELLKTIRIPNPAEDEFAYAFSSALGDRQPGAYPDYHNDFTEQPKVKLELKRAAVAGGCG